MASNALSWRFRRAAQLVLGGVLVAAALPMSAGPAQAAGSDATCSATPDKCYSLTITASPTPRPGAASTYTGTITNQSRSGTGVQLGAANISWSPSNAFYSVTPGGVSPSGTQTYVAPNTLQLRNLNLAPGSSATFTFQATALRGQTITFSSTAKQSNGYLGTGNDLYASTSSPVVEVSQFCSDNLVYNAYGCKGYLKVNGATITTGSTDSDGNPSLVTATMTIPPVTPAVGSSPVQVMALRSYLSGDECPALVPCTFTVQLMNKLDSEYDAAHASTLAISCGSLCDSATLWFQQEESTGTTEPLPPCTPLGPLPSLLEGSTACYDLALTGGITVRNITTDNDWKVMGLTLG